MTDQAQLKTIARSSSARARTIWHRTRMMTAPLRTLPDFLIIGAQKSGTTSLYEYLVQHPAVLPALQKEVHYFDLNYDAGQAWYRAMFPLQARRARVEKRNGGTVAIGEATPYYLYHPLVPARASALVPDARIVAILRDPVDRAWSHYKHELAANRETLSFEAALDAEPQRLAGASIGIGSGRTDLSVRHHRTSAYFSRGLYAEQLTRWMDHYPRSAFHIMRAEDLFETPAVEWERLVQFLGVDTGWAPRFAVHNRGRETPVPDQARARLAQEYAEPNRRLAELLGPSFAWS